MTTVVMNNDGFISVKNEITKTSANAALLIMLHRETNHGHNTTTTRRSLSKFMTHDRNCRSLSIQETIQYSFDDNIKKYSQKYQNNNNFIRKQQRSLSSSSSSNPSSISYTGTVKFYLREKGYGFIVTDMNNNTTTSNSNKMMDIFVHHSSLISSIIPKVNHDNDGGDNSNDDDNADKTSSNNNTIDVNHNKNTTKHNFQMNVKYPFLKTGERVRYNIKRIPTDGTIQAIDVTWLNGTPIPPLRLNYLGGVHERSKIILGNAIYDLLHQYTPQHHQSFSFDTLDQNDLATILIKLQNHYNEANETIISSEELITSLGMNIQDFPIVKSMDSSKRGKYEYNDSNTNDNEGKES